jgi:hypothetical protein
VKKLVGTFIFLFLSCFSFATHQVGGYIAYTWLGGYTYQITVYDYTNTYGTSADRDGLRVYYGDGTSDSVARMNGLPNWLIPGDNTPNGQPLCNWDLNSTPPTPLNGARKVNIYQSIHTYLGPGNYHIWIDDQDRMASINNMINSVGTDYYMYNTLTIPITPQPYINSPLITNSPVCQYGCTGVCYTYNPGAYIPNLPVGADDSISYSLGSSLMLNPSDPTVPEVATGYFNPGATVDQVRGTLSWCNPTQEGIYNFVILMITYQRSYLSVGGVTVKSIQPIDTAELEVEVIINQTCITPQVTTRDTCVEAGASISIPFTVEPLGLEVFLSGAGEPFSRSPAGTLSKVGGPFSTDVTTTFNWTTNCSEVRENPYEVVVRATDKVIENGFPPDTNYYSGY